MRPIHTIFTMILLSQLAIGCSDNESDSMPPASESGTDSLVNDPLDEGLNEGT